MNVTAVEVTRGVNGKLWPARRLTHEQLNQRRWLAHNLVHRDHLSIRAAQRLMRDSHGIRRSIGAIHNDLARFECPACAGRPAAGGSSDG
jgi:hypothetical protein